MSVQTFHPTPVDQSVTNWAVAQRIVGPFAPHAQTAPDMTVALDAGYLLSGTTLTEVNAQTIGPFTPPTSGFRIDRVVVDRSTGAASIVAGAADSPTPPAIPSGTLPVARVFLESSSTAVTNEILADERALFDVTTPTGDQVICRASLGGTNQTGLSPNTWNKVNLSVAHIDIGNGFDAANRRFKPSVAGYYSVQFVGYFNGSLLTTSFAGLSKNGSHIAAVGAHHSNQTQWTSANVGTTVYLNGTTDYVEATANPGGNTGTLHGGVAYTWFCATLIR